MTQSEDGPQLEVSKAQPWKMLLSQKEISILAEARINTASEKSEDVRVLVERDSKFTELVTLIPVFQRA